MFKSKEDANAAKTMGMGQEIQSIAKDLLDTNKALSKSINQIKDILGAVDNKLGQLQTSIDSLPEEIRKQPNP